MPDIRPVDDRRRDRIELRETTRKAALVILCTLAAGASVIALAFIGALVTATSLAVRAALIAGVTLVVVISVRSTLRAVRRRSRFFVLELGRDLSKAFDVHGSSGHAILRAQSGEILGQTSDGSLRVQVGRYWFMGGRGGSGFRAAIALATKSGLVVALPTIGPVPVRETAPDIGLPTLPHLFPREYEYLARLAPAIADASG